MFNKANETQDSPMEQTTAPREPVKSSGMPSIISSDLRVVGNLHCSGDMQIEGIVEGDINSQTVTVGEGAQVSGSIRGDTVRVSGAVQGQIEAGAVTLAKTAQVTGDVIHKTLSIEAGAYLEGMCRRMEEKKSGAGQSAGQSAGQTAGQTKVSDHKSSAREPAGAAASAGGAGASAAGASAAGTGESATG